MHYIKGKKLDLKLTPPPCFNHEFAAFTIASTFSFVKSFCTTIYIKMKEEKHLSDTDSFWLNNINFLLKNTSWQLLVTGSAV